MMKCTANLQPRASFLDIAKGIGIILVVLGHTFGKPEIIYDTIYSFHMPLFFIISGYVYKPEKYNEFGFKKILLNKAKRYLIPFYIFAAINLVLTLGFDLIFKHTVPTLSTIKTYVLGTLYCYADMRYMPNCSPIWFLMTLFIGGVIFWALMKYFNKSRPILAVSLLGISYLLYLFVDFRLPLNLAPTGAAVFLMYIGYLIKRFDVLKHKSLLLLGIVGFIASCLNKTNVGMNENTYGNLVLFSIAAICLSVFLLLICKSAANFNNPVNRFLKWLGSNTLPIMAFNYFMRSFSTEFYYLIPVVRNYPIHWTVSFLLTMAGCIVLIPIYNFIKSRFKKPNSNLERI